MEIIALQKSPSVQVDSVWYIRNFADAMRACGDTLSPT